MLLQKRKARQFCVLMIFHLERPYNFVMRKICYLEENKTCKSHLSETGLLKEEISFLHLNIQSFSEFKILFVLTASYFIL